MPTPQYDNWIDARRDRTDGSVILEQWWWPGGCWRQSNKITLRDKQAQQLLRSMARLLGYEVTRRHDDDLFAGEPDYADRPPPAPVRGIKLDSSLV